MESQNHDTCCGSRREFLWETGAGFTGLAMTALLDADGFFTRQGHAAGQSATKLAGPSAPKPPHFVPKAKKCLFLFMRGGPSQMDLFDYKPELQKRDGQTVQMEIRRRDVRPSKLLASRRTFQKVGESGQWWSDALPLFGQHADKFAIIKSLYTDSFAHGSALLQLNCGRIIQGHPSLGSWLSYGLGTMNQNLPGFVVMIDPRGGPASGTVNWSGGYMPAAYQGTVFRSTGQPVLNLASPTSLPADSQSDRIDTINALNAEHLATRPGYSELKARMASYELAFRLQTAAPEALDLSQETEATKEMYGFYDPKPDHPLSLGSGPFARQCLIARRLLERGVRFVQIYQGGGHQQQNWDAHQGVEENLSIHCPEFDRPASALLLDLERRGLLDETLVVIGGEFGRQPVSQMGDGRDHNPKGFTYLLAGAGVKQGISYGETDELGHEASVNRHHIRDLHATILHLMGLDPNNLTYFFGGLDQKLVGPAGADPIHAVLA